MPWLVACDRQNYVPLTGHRTRDKRRRLDIGWRWTYSRFVREDGRWFYIDGDIAVDRVAGRPGGVIG
jgi:uncharacterized protein YchJ